ncbi:hypothetical protein AC477_01940 [miscellaneous Crenarchaeota group-1 archaeon SG8-32-1]|uniref:Uncharacterized protein n=1 Tax=miscellaneous Crenarchaeota group-1 archaeon SG8-32-1 TaxID=1685124 RepID=A0A0M0BXE5_9ARCH|nr:MAG: hypothetical protein AC477_01940 [miscellaneous Crenarchaeota group-1 archaeon SG8-32-1]
MPVLIYEGPELNPNQRKELIKVLTKVKCKVTSEISKEAYYIFRKKHPDDKIGVGECILPEYSYKLQKMRNK